MAINLTTLSGAVGITDTQIGVVSATGITAPVSTTGSGFTYLLIDQEVMFVTAVLGTFVSVLRGQLGTSAVAHVTAAPVLAGLPSDFSNFNPAISATSLALPQDYSPVSASCTGATIAPTGAFFHFTGTTALVTITPPTGLLNGGKVTIVFDGSASGLTWTAAGNISVAGTATTAKSAVSFFYDSSTSTPKWVPDRLA